MANKEWGHEAVFEDEDFVAAGQLIIAPGGRKPSRRVNDNTYVCKSLFYELCRSILIISFRFSTSLKVR
jgi:hypothetical protein